MTLITRVSRLRAPGVLRQFTWPASLSDFGRFNLIYGWNGTGKTCLSRVLRSLELRKSLPKDQAVIRIGAHEVRGEDFASLTTPVRVFNRDFVNEAVFPAGGGDVPPIFVIGKESAEKQKEVDRLKSERKKAEAELDGARSKKQDAERAFDRFCVDRARLIKDRLRSSGSNLYNNYDKASFRSRADQMATDNDAVSHGISDADRDSLLAQHQASPKPRLAQLTYQVPSLQQTANEVNELLSSTVVSEVINALRDDSVLAEWVRRGLALHQERKADQCMFCEQRLPSGRLDALEAHFNAEYQNFMSRIEAKINELQAAVKQVAELVMPNKAELYDDLIIEYGMAAQSLRKGLDAVRGFLDTLIQRLETKKGRPFESLAEDACLPSLDDDLVTRLNAIIRKHNQASDGFQSRLTAARDRLALDMIASDLTEFVKLRDAVNEADASARAAEEELQRLVEEIARVLRDIEEYHQPAEELNEDLRKYLGHDELRLEIKETGYTITRNGVLAETLSEGESTAIALLYFLKSLRDRRFDLKQGIVVLDDPVSSLDANALYFAFGFIHERTKDAGQLFIFTHNFTFFRQVRNWFHYLKGQKSRQINERPARFYMLECASGEGQRCSVLVPLDPLLERYESEYHYLFSRIYREASISSSPRLEESYSLPNIARRVLEGFLAFRQPHVAGALWHKLKDVEFDEAKKLRILRFVHTYSHGDTVGEPQHDPSVLAEGRSVLKDLLDLIRAQDADHFAAMEALIRSSEEERNAK